MQTFNINDYITIYPTSSGFEKIKSILVNSKEQLGFKDLNEIEEYIGRRRTTQGGYRDQMWTITSKFSALFFNGSNYFETTEIELNS